MIEQIFKIYIVLQKNKTLIKLFLGWDEDDNVNTRISSITNTFGSDKGLSGFTNNFSSFSKNNFSSNYVAPYEKKPEFDVKSVIHV